MAGIRGGCENGRKSVPLCHLHGSVTGWQHRSRELNDTMNENPPPPAEVPQPAVPPQNPAPPPDVQAPAPPPAAALVSEGEVKSERELQLERRLAETESAKIERERRIAELERDNEELKKIPAGSAQPPRKRRFGPIPIISTGDEE